MGFYKFFIIPLFLFSLLGCSEDEVDNSDSDSSTDDQTCTSGSLWFIGGENTTETLNKVWKSTDEGATWTEVGLIPGDRLHHSIVSFDSKLWVLGGNNGTGAKKSVWSSSDGDDWSVVGVLDEARQSGAAFSFNEKLWYIGGTHKDEDDISVYEDQVWSSEDGVTWSESVYTLPLDLIYSSPVIFKEQMWLIGGSTADDTYTNSVLASEDGETWTTMEELPLDSIGLAASVVFDDKIWVFGGWTGTEILDTIIVSDEDGLAWETKAETLPVPIEAAGVATDGCKIWLAGGMTTDGVDFSYINAVFVSEDGVTWEQAGTIPETAFAGTLILY